MLSKWSQLNVERTIVLSIGPKRLCFLPEDGDIPLSETSFLFKIRMMDNVQEVVIVIIFHLHKPSDSIQNRQMK
jgi:hypothetical protein